VVPLIVVGATAATVLAEAERLQVGWIVVGSHGHGALHHLLLGSVAEELIRKADRPVVVVPRPGG
jgi:nucleotide-binding universal stress UspA family protein